MKPTKTQLKKFVEKVVLEQLARQNKKARKPLKENSMMFGMAKPSTMANPFERSRSSSGANSRLNETIMLNKLEEAQEHLQELQEVLGDVAKLATIKETGNKTKSTKKIINGIEEQVRQVRKVVNRLLGNG